MIKSQIVFFGTGPVAAKSLELLSKNFEIEAVVTKPVPAHHKGTFPVTELCKKNNSKIIEVSNKSDIVPALKSANLTSKVGIVIDFGIILDQETIDFFPLGLINSHFSLLPEWRGADPITFALLSGQKKTGVTIAKVTLALDEGDILTQAKYSIKPNTTIDQLTSDLIFLSNDLLIEFMPKYLTGELELRKQSSGATYSKKLHKSDGIIDLTKTAEVLEREVRAYLGWPGSTLDLKLKDGSNLKITVTSASTKEEGDSPLSFKTSKDYFVIEKLKLPGKSEMTAKDFLNGYKNKLKS